MSKKILSGFLLRNVYILSDIEMVINSMKSEIAVKASLAYNELVAREAERIVDEITLNRRPRPENCSILDEAMSIVTERVRCAEAGMQPTEYCLYAGLQILSGTIKDKPVTYLKFIAPNDIYSKRLLKKVKDLEKYDITDDEIRDSMDKDEKYKGEKVKFFESMSRKYEVDIPLICNLLNYNDIKLNIDGMKFRSTSERAKDIAKEQVLNYLVSCYGMNRNIPPEKIMEFFGKALNRLTYESGKQMLESEEESCERHLIEITKELITQPGMIIKNENPENKPSGDLLEETNQTKEIPSESISNENGMEVNAVVNEVEVKNENMTMDDLSKDMPLESEENIVRDVD